MPSRNPVIAIIVVTDSPHGGPTTGGPVSGPVFKRIAEAALRYLGVGPSINPPSPVLVARHDESAGHTPASGAAAAESTISLVADGPPGTVPDLRGMSARDAVRKLVKLGMNARATGDGFVISQTPEPGAPIDGDSLCRLVLERRPPRHGATASRP